MTGERVFETSEAEIVARADIPGRRIAGRDVDVAQSGLGGLTRPLPMGFVATTIRCPHERDAP